MHRALVVPLLFASVAIAQQKPTPETAAWWAQTTALSSDAMEGRDTGTEAYERAAKYVADQFAAAGLKPAGDAVEGKATFFQRVPMHQTDLDTVRSTVEVEVADSPSSDSVGLVNLKPWNKSLSKRLQLFHSTRGPTWFFSVMA